MVKSGMSMHFTNSVSMNNNFNGPEDTQVDYLPCNYMRAV